jgi:acyl carrier protein
MRLDPVDDSHGHERSWDGFVTAVATAAHVRPEAITPSTRLDEDLGIDSLALAEVVVVLIVDFGMDAMAEQLDQRDWSGVTVGELYDEYRATAEPG